MRWLHVLSGVMWIGLLWYFNFVQTPSMPQDPRRAETRGEQGDRAGGAVLVPLGGARDGGDRRAARVDERATSARRSALQRPFTAIGIGMWLGLIMAFNVWFIIWPNQKKALGIVQVSPEEKAQGGEAGRA